MVNGIKCLLRSYHFLSYLLFCVCISADAATVQFGTAVLDDLSTMGSIRPTANASGISTDFMIFLSAETLQSGMRLVIDQSNYMEYGVESMVMEAGTECGHDYFGTLIYDWAQTSPESYIVSIGKMESIYLGYAAQDRFVNPNEQYYGWMELYLSSDNVLTIRNSAVDINGNSIIVGAIPEPSSALLLLVGCAGLALRRRRMPLRGHLIDEQPVER